MLSSRERYAVFGLVVGLILISGGLTVLATFVGINPRNVYFFEDNYKATYDAKGGYALKGISTVGIDVTSLTPTTKAKVTQGRSSKFIKTTPKGFYISENGPTDYYTLFWVFMENPMTLKSMEGKTYQIVDPTGLILEENETYELVIENSTILWSEVISSQASYEATIYDENVKVASALYDATCGLLFRLETHENGYSSIDLESTNFPISRNRNFNLGFALVIVAGTLIGTFIWSEKSEMNFEKRNTILKLLSVGFACSIVDLFIDIWFFELSSSGLIATHLILALILFYWIRRWAIPAFFEIGLVLAFSYTYLNGALFPMVAYFPGLLVTWMSMYFLVTLRGFRI